MHAFRDMHVADQMGRDLQRCARPAARPGGCIRRPLYPRHTLYFTCDSLFTWGSLSTGPGSNIMTMGCKFHDEWHNGQAYLGVLRRHRGSIATLALQLPRQEMHWYVWHTFLGHVVCHACWLVMLLFSPICTAQLRCTVRLKNSN
jgi:hypothetical protein